MQIQAYRGFFGGLALFTILTALSGGAAADPGNGKGHGQKDGSDDNGGSPAPYLSFAASRTEVLVGESVSLSWASLNTKHCFASGDWSGKLATDGTYTTGSLDGPKTYVLECKDGGSAVSATVSIAVTSADVEPEPAPEPEPEPEPTPEPEPVAAPTLDLSVADHTLASGDSTTLSWTTTDADSCTASGGWSGDKGTGGSESTGVIDGDTTFTLSCSGAGGSVSDSVAVSVAAQPTVDLVAAESAVAVGSSTELTWTSSDADSCTASGGWSGDKATGGSESTGSIDGDTTFTLSCSGLGGSVSDSVAVSVAAQPTVDLAAAESVVAVGGSTELVWTSSDADSCTASGGWTGDKPADGSESVGPLEQSTTYSLSCSGTGGTTMDMISVSINDQVTLNWQAPVENEDGSALTDLAGYRVYYGLTSGNYTDSLSIDSSGATSHALTLSSGTYYFAMTALNMDGSESGYSNEVVKSVD